MRNRGFFQEKWYVNPAPVTGSRSPSAALMYIHGSTQDTLSSRVPYPLDHERFTTIKFFAFELFELL